MSRYRTQRLNDLLRDEISALILNGRVKDYRVSNFLSVNRVDISRDLCFAKVYVSSFLPDAQVQKGVEGLNSAAGFIQRVLAGKMRIRQFPHLTFYFDKSMKDGFNMAQRLSQMEAERERSERDSSSALRAESSQDENATE